MRQQRLAPLSDGEGDRVEVVTGGLQRQSVQRQEARHGLAAGERAERHKRKQLRREHGGKRDSVENDFEFVASQRKAALKHEVACKLCDTSEGHCADCSSVCPGVRSPWSGCGDWRAVMRCGRWDWGVLPASPESGGDSD